MSGNQKIINRPLKKSDGIHLWRLAGNTHSLDLNSLYHYLLFSHHFAECSVVAETDSGIVGFATGYIPPGQPDTLFIWQAAVDSESRGNGIGKRMILDVYKRNRGCGITFIEATITPSNKSSIGLFTSVARQLHADWEYSDVMFPKTAFGSEKHEAEILFRIGPISPS